MQANRFRWPGPDPRPITGAEPPRFTYGFMFAKLFLRIREGLIDIASHHGAPVVRRTDQIADRGAIRILWRFGVP